MGRPGRRRALMGAAVLSCLALLPAAVVGEAGRADAAEPEPAAEASTSLGAVAVPYLGSTSIEPAPGWQISDCAVPSAATPLVTACEPTKLTLTATTFDPEAPAIVVPVPQSNGETSLVFDYSVTLAPPETPTVNAVRLGFPVAAGSTVMLPIGDLGIECAVCTTGGSIDVIGVEPRSAGTAAATGTHVVFRPSAAFSGDAGITVRFADDFGAWSAESVVEVPVYRPATPLIATSVYLANDGAEQAIDLGGLVFGADADDLHFIGCGAAVHGTVVCRPDGTASYVPAAASVDQFSYHVASATGEQATGSVTIVGADAELPGAGLVPASAARDGDDGVASKIVPRVPVETDATGRDGVFSPLIDTFDRAGVR
ncbi:Ig-like domain-containing protein [Agromyces sp. NPDC055520]